jgi:hypothetical protein
VASILHWCRHPRAGIVSPLPSSSSLLLPQELGPGRRPDGTVVGRVNPTSLAGVARIEEASENDGREHQDCAAHSDVPTSGLASATGARLVPLYRCSFWGPITMVSVVVPSRSSRFRPGGPGSASLSDRILAASRRAPPGASDPPRSRSGSRRRTNAVSGGSKDHDGIS